MTAVADRHSTDADAGGRPQRPAGLLWALAALAAAALVIGAIANVLHSPTPLAAGSPEQVVQAYLQAVFDGDYSDAREYLAEDVARSCSTADFRQAWIPQSLTAALEDVRVDGDTVEVVVRLRTEPGPDPFGIDDFASQEMFVLAQRQGQWRIEGDPWPVWSCEVEK